MVVVQPCDTSKDLKAQIYQLLKCSVNIKCKYLFSFTNKSLIILLEVLHFKKMIIFTSTIRLKSFRK